MVLNVDVIIHILWFNSEENPFEIELKWIESVIICNIFCTEIIKLSGYVL